jgi:hypothetical protein
MIVSNTLTPYQINILNELKDKETYLATNEGANYRAWVKYPNGDKKTVRKDTVSLLFSKGYIEVTEGPNNVFYYYSYTGKRF